MSTSDRTVRSIRRILPPTSLTCPEIRSNLQTPLCRGPTPPRLLEPEHIALVRMVVGVADRIPAPAQSFFQAGPVAGARRIAGYFEQLVAAGRLDMPDVEAAAWQFLSLCTHPVMVRTLMAADREPTAEVIAAHARRSAAMVFAAYPLLNRGGAGQSGGRA